MAVSVDYSQLASYIIYSLVYIGLSIINARFLWIVCRSRSSGIKKLPRTILSISLGANLANLLYGLTQLSFSIIPADHGGVLYSIPVLATLLVMIILVLAGMIYILFCWIGIIALNKSAKQQKRIMTYRKVTCIGAIIYVVLVFIICAIFYLKFTNYFSVLYVALPLIGLVPLVASICFLVFSRKLLILIRQLQNSDKQRAFSSKLTILSIIYVVTMDLSALFVVAAVFQGAIFQPEILPTIWFLLYLPIMVSGCATLWFFSPRYVLQIITPSVESPPVSQQQLQQHDSGSANQSRGGDDSGQASSSITLSTLRMTSTTTENNDSGDNDVKIVVQASTSSDSSTM
eukprot:TRINITY_DN5263_c0_g1_i5.p1 TRINITY_DN5263_c0_g1~~TRINITY_DN5263_c0_g1_i5.p1  ORF type:complete len:370 (-),score=52.36 TRINITY_DN5263_c0_g1_i5:42-1076(-)